MISNESRCHCAGFASPSLTFWRQLEQSQIDPLPVYHLTPAELLSPFPTTERVIRDVLSDEESVVEGTVVAQAPLGRGWRETLLD